MRSEQPFNGARIAQRLNQEIRRGFYPVGSFLPSQVMLMKRFGVSRSAVLRGLKLLESGGVVRVEAGRRRILPYSTTAWCPDCAAVEASRELAQAQVERVATLCDRAEEGQGPGFPSFDYSWREKLTISVADVRDALRRSR